MEHVIEINHLVKTYGKSRGVSDISFHVDAGDFFGFIGPNGAGKSTTIRSMLGLIHMSSGSIKIFGQDVEKHHTDILRRIGYMPSETIFYPNLTVSQMIKLTADAYHVDCSKKAAELCERLQVDTNKRIDELSLGNRKKVSIVCMMQHQPELYIFDEPTSGLDPLMQKEFFHLLNEVHKEGAVIFFSSHVLSEIQNYCNKAAIIKEGKLVAVDTVVNLSKTAARRVTLRGCHHVPMLEGIDHINQENDIVTFLYQGDAKRFIHAIAEVEAEDIIIEEPSLEEIVMHYYGKEQSI